MLVGMVHGYPLTIHTYVSLALENALWQGSQPILQMTEGEEV